MAAKKSVKKYAGVYFTESKVRKWRGRADRAYWIAFKDSRTGKLCWERCGWASEGWNPEAAQRKRYEVLEKDRAGKYKPKKKRQAEKMTLGDFVEKHYLPWVDQNWKTPRDEHSLYRTWIEPRFAKKPFQAITPLDLERLKKDMKAAGRSGARIVLALGFISRTFNKAGQWGLWHGISPTKNISFSKPNNSRQKFLSPAEASMILSGLKQLNHQVFQIATISLYTGMRQGEVLDLTWSDVDTVHGVISLMDTKSQDRPVFITEPIKAILDELTPGAPEDRLFPITQRHPGPWVSAIFKQAVDNLGLNEGITDRRQRICFHTLRHSYASWAVMAGEPLYAVGKALGHSDLSMTQRYSHLAPDSHRSVSEAVAAAEQ